MHTPFIYLLNAVVRGLAGDGVSGAPAIPHVTARGQAMWLNGVANDLWVSVLVVMDIYRLGVRSDYT